MKKKILKNFVSLAVIILLTIPVFAFALSAQAADTVTGWGSESGTTETDIQSATGLGAEDPRAMAATIINVALGFLGIIAVVIIIIGGFKWMTASGNEDKVAEAKKLIVAGIIGLVIILAAYAIAKFVLEQLMTATGAV